MPTDTRIAQFLLGELIAALCAHAPHLFRRWLQVVTVEAQHVHMAEGSIPELSILMQEESQS